MYSPQEVIYRSLDRGCWQRWQRRRPFLSCLIDVAAAVRFSFFVVVVAWLLSSGCVSLWIVSTTDGEAWSAQGRWCLSMMTMMANFLFEGGVGLPTGEKLLLS